MGVVDTGMLLNIVHDRDAQETALRQVVADRLAKHPAPVMNDHLVATYFFAFRTMTLEQGFKEIAYHATSGTKDIPPGSLLEQCTAVCAGVDAFDASGRVGLVHVAFPLKMMLHPDGRLTSNDIYHTVANAIIFDVYENQEARLLNVSIPEHVIRTFPGPAYGPVGLRKVTGFADADPAFGRFLKPTAGITPDDVERIVLEAARCPLFLFIKEDENLYPDLDYSPVAERARRAAEALRRVQDQREGKGLIFAPHITGAPNEILDTVAAALEAGATGVMFSETFAGGTVRMVREATKDRQRPPAIYGHNAGICTRTWAVWREVIDLFARLVGIDFRQTAPLRPGTPFIRPFAAEWEASEHALTRELPGIAPTMITRAGGLDQGNIGLNLADVERRGISDKVLFLAGSAINSIKNKQGKPDSTLGAEAMMQAVDVHKSGELKDVPIEEHTKALAALAERKNLTALREALRQRYPEIN